MRMIAHERLRCGTWCYLPEIFMGTFGAALYSDDGAADLRSAIGVLAKLPLSGEQIVEALRKEFNGPFDLDEEGGPASWLVLADQFRKRGLDCPRVFETALVVVDGGLDIRDWRSRGADAAFIAQRQKVLGTLRQSFTGDRTVRPRPNRTARPSPSVAVGEVYVFPTMDGAGCNAFCSKQTIDSSFRPNGTGVALIVATGFAFDWVPWCAYACLTGDPQRAPSLDDVARAHFLNESGAEICLPRRSHMRKLKMSGIGRLSIDEAKGRASIADGKRPIQAVLADWSFGLFSSAEPCDGNVSVADLCG